MATGRSGFQVCRYELQVSQSISTSVLYIDLLSPVAKGWPASYPSEPRLDWCLIPSVASVLQSPSILRHCHYFGQGFLFPINDIAPCYFFFGYFSFQVPIQFLDFIFFGFIYHAICITLYIYIHTIVSSRIAQVNLVQRQHVPK